MTRFLRSDRGIALAAILVLAAALRLVGIRYGLPLSVLNPDESNIVPRAWRMGHGHLDPGWYDYPSLLMACSRRCRRSSAARRSLPRDSSPSHSGSAASAPRGGSVGARTAPVRRSSALQRRRCDDPRRLLANGRHGRAADARHHMRPRARRRGTHRVGRARGRARRVGQVSGCDRGRARRRGGVGEVASARPGRGARGRGVRPDEPVRARSTRELPGTTSRACSASRGRAGSASRTTRSPRSPTSTGSGMRSARS